MILLYIQEKLLSRLTFNPGLALTSFRTTRSRDTVVVRMLVESITRERRGGGVHGVEWSTSNLSYFQTILRNDFQHTVSVQN